MRNASPTFKDLYNHQQRPHVGLLVLTMGRASQQRLGAEPEILFCAPILNIPKAEIRLWHMTTKKCRNY
jgi:hypothetical protein